MGSTATRSRQNGTWRGRSLLPFLMLCGLTSATAGASTSTTNVFSAEESSQQQQQQQQQQHEGSNILKDRQQPPVGKRQRPNSFQSRIIGGSQPKQGRYPYIVAILTQGGSDAMAPACGGTLIAPDVVMTAAHCRESRLRTVHVGRYNRTDPRENFEIFTIQEQLSHPRYQDDSLGHDIMLLKLSGVSNNSVVSLNRDPAIPAANDDLLVLGFGVTQLGGDLVISASKTLQSGTVQYVPNSVCEMARSPDAEESYQGRIAEDMLCAWGDGVDACQGDSGSGLIANGETVQDDVQVGVTSWGYRCAHPDFPGVYARVSYLWDWIASQVCQMSVLPPLAFKCQSMITSGGLPDGTYPVLPQSTGILMPVTLNILFDSYASEIGWKIKDYSGNTIASVPFNTYIDGRKRALRTLFLEEGNQYSFIIEDSYRDGLCCTKPGHYTLTMNVPGGPIKVLVFGKGDFGATQRNDFLISMESTNTTTVENPESIASPTSDLGTVALRVIIQLDENPTETGWMVERIGYQKEIVAHVPPNTYQVPKEQVVIEIDLEEGELYRFVIWDHGGNGIDGGHVRLYLGRLTTQGMAVAVFDHDGSFTSPLQHYFLSSEEIPSLPVDVSQYLTLELRMDLYPEEVGFQVRVESFDGIGATDKRASDIIFFRPPSFYNTSLTNQVVHETIPIPYGGSNPVKHFTLMMIDAYGDGLCCSWQGRSSNTGYTLRKSDASQEEVIVSSSFASTAREEYSFSITTPTELNEEYADIAYVNDMLDPSPTEGVTIIVVLALDHRPYETGYSIVDSEGHSVVDVMPGTYRDENSTVKENHSLAPGVYTFTISDTNGDGIVTRPGEAAYEVLLTGVNRLTVLSEVGQFGAQQERDFILEGELASIPILVKIDHDNNPVDVGFQVERLDLPESEALVATFAPGRHLNFDGGVSASLVLQLGGLYRLKLLNTAATNLTGTTAKIAMGSHATFLDLDIRQKPKFLVQSNEEQFVLSTESTTNLPFFSLSIPSQLHSREIDWVLLAVKTETSLGQPYSKHKVISFGPDETSIHEEFRNDAKTIPLPQEFASPEQTFILIVSHSAGPGCCTGAFGTGLIQLFQGPPEENVVLIETSFNGESRLVERFHILLHSVTAAQGSLAATSESPSNTGFLGTVLICGSLFLLFCYALFKMSRDDDK